MNPLKEYTDMIKLLDSSQASKDDVYQQLMEKEANTLEIINRVSENLSNKQEADRLMYNLSLLEIVAMLTNTWKNIIDEIVIQRNLDVNLIFWQGERKIFTGITVVMIGMILFFVHVST